MIGVLFSTAGGIAVFLFGLRILSDSLQRAAGDRMRSLLERLTGKAYRGVIVGAVTSGVLQSSSMTMVLLIGLLNAGILGLGQAIGVMLGAEIGTTLTAQIVAFKIGLAYMPAIAIGFALSEIRRDTRWGDAGRAILGLGLLFLGMSLLSGGLAGLTESPAVSGLLQACGENLALGVLVGAAVTGVIQSSSAVTAMVIGLGSSNLISLPAAVALVLGANIGTTMTAQIASIGGSLSARRLAAAQLVVNVLGVGVFLPVLPWYVRWIEATSASLPRQIANAHSLFNVVVTLALIPLVGSLVWVVRKIVRGREAAPRSGARFLGDEFLATPAVAVRQAEREVLRMGALTVQMILSCREGLAERNAESTSAVFETEETVDILKAAVDAFLDRIDGSSLVGREERRLDMLRHIVADVERVGDQAVNIAIRASKIRARGQNLSESALAELMSMFDQAIEIYGISLRALEAEDVASAQQAFEREKRLDQSETLFKRHHVERLESSECDPESGILFVEILHNLERIGDHAVNIAGDVLVIHSGEAEAR